MQDGDDEAIARALEEDFKFEQNEEISQKLDEDFDSSFIEALEAIDNDPFAWEDKKVEDKDGKKNLPLSVVDQQWEIIDPNPNIHQLFIQFNEEFFFGVLKAVAVSWSSRMTLCAGVCSYEGRGGLCAIRLSQPLLKFRPRRDLVETLLHEMIHAYLFVTDNNRDHDGHGPNFLSHMKRINAKTGSKITVYHSFNDEVDYQRKHWWKCDGPCQKRRPYYGLVKRAMNRAPSSKDPWWSFHQSSCGGTFIKIKEPEKPVKKNASKPSIAATASAKDIRTFFPRTPPASGSGVRKGNGTSNRSSTQNRTGGSESLGTTQKSTIATISSLEPVDPDPRKERGLTVFQRRGFVPFSGVGHALGDSSSSKNNGVSAESDRDQTHSSAKKVRSIIPVLKPSKHHSKSKASHSGRSAGSGSRSRGGSRTIVLSGKVKTEEHSPELEKSPAARGEPYLYNPFNGPGHVLGDSDTAPPKDEKAKTEMVHQRSLDEYVDSKPSKKRRTVVFFSSDSEDGYGDDKNSSVKVIKPPENLTPRAPESSLQKVHCPVCGDEVPAASMNTHLDSCLEKS